MTPQMQMAGTILTMIPMTLYDSGGSDYSGSDDTGDNTGDNTRDNTGDNGMDDSFGYFWGLF